MRTEMELVMEGMQHLLQKAQDGGVRRQQAESGPNWLELAGAALWSPVLCCLQPPAVQHTQSEALGMRDNHQGRLSSGFQARYSSTSRERPARDTQNGLQLAHNLLPCIWATSNREHTPHTAGYGPTSGATAVAKTCHLCTCLGSPSSLSSPTWHLTTILAATISGHRARSSNVRFGPDRWNRQRAVVQNHQKAGPQWLIHHEKEKDSFIMKKKGKGKDKRLTMLPEGFEPSPSRTGT